MEKRSTAKVSPVILRSSSALRAIRKGTEKETDSPKTPFWTTVSPHDAFSAPLARSDSHQIDPSHSKLHALSWRGSMKIIARASVTLSCASRITIPLAWQRSLILCLEYPWLSQSSKRSLQGSFSGHPAEPQKESSNHESLEGCKFRIPCSFFDSGDHICFSGRIKHAPN